MKTIRSKMNAYQMLIKQMEYEVETLETVLRMKDEGKSDKEISEFIGIGKTEVRLIKPAKLKKFKKQLNQYKGESI